MTLVRVFYPSGGDEREYLFRDEWTRGGAGPTRLEEVFCAEVAESGREAADAVYAICNSTTDDRYCAARYAEDVRRWVRQRRRSMSVGDVALVGDRWLAASAMGWTDVDPAVLARLEIVEED